MNYLTQRTLRSTFTVLAALCSVCVVFCAPCLSAYDTTCNKPGSLYQVKIEGPFVAEHEGYTVCYNAQTLNPIWVYEYLTAQDLTGPAVRKSSKRFTIDKLIPSRFQPRHEDYARTSTARFDRGHMAACANHQDEQEHMDETFLVTNISPQVGKNFNTNPGGWFQLEEQVRAWVENDGFSAHIIMGPLYRPESGVDPREVSYQVIGGEVGVAVPTHFFKVIFLEDATGRLKTKAYVLPNRAFRTDESFRDFKADLKDIESWAGLSIQPTRR